MSDAAPDPMDKAYAEAEAVLDDDRARAARRARVLAAVASEPAVAPTVSAPPARRPAWAPGGWLAAACVAGVSVFLAIRVNPPTTIGPQPAPPAADSAIPVPSASAPMAQTPREAAASPPAAATRPPASPPVVVAAPSQAQPPPPPVAADAAPAYAPTAPAELAESAPAPPPPAADVQAARRRPAVPFTAGRSSSEKVEEVVVTASRIESRTELRAERKAARAAEQEEKLRAAAAAGRTDEVKALLAKRIPVDAPDEEGETALMKSIQARHPETAALLRRHGAKLDLKNRAGVSARQMADKLDDPKLDEALGLSR